MVAKKMLIGLTGSIGSGKSRVSELFALHGALVIDADIIAKALLDVGEKGWVALEDVFSNRFFKEDGTLDRQKLRLAIFEDPELRRTIDTILHPLVRDEVFRIYREKANDCLLTVIEVPLLYESGWQDDFDQVLVVVANKETCLDRIMTRDGVSRPQAVKAMEAQMDIADKVAMADHVIDNNGTWNDTATQVKELIRKLIDG